MVLLNLSRRYIPKKLCKFATDWSGAPIKRYGYIYINIYSKWPCNQQVQEELWLDAGFKE